MTKKPIIIGAAALAIFAVVLFALVKGGAQNKPDAAPAASPPVQTVTVTAVVSQELNRQLRLPGEIQAYQDVAIYPKVPGFIESIPVDRGSAVKKGQVLARLSAPELRSRTNEAAAKVQQAASQRLEAEARVRSIHEQRLEAIARLASDEGTYRHLKKAAETPGVVAGNDVEVAGRTVEAEQAHVRLLEANEKAAEAQAKSYAENEKATRDNAQSVKDIENYLVITAPFSGVITERNVHPGSMVGPPGGPNSSPPLRLQELGKLRLTVAVPEADVSGVTLGAAVNFTVPAFPGETFDGVVRRIGESLDSKTRTMPVELDVANVPTRLTPGMYAEVLWPARRPQNSLFVPPSAIAVTTEHTFVVRIKDGKIEWVDVKRGMTVGKPGSDLVEVFGSLQEGDQIAVRGTDELRENSQVNIKLQQPPVANK